ncbi:EamA family transporter [bacterium]|nr:EamA family transporter [bacterium]
MNAFYWPIVLVVAANIIYHLSQKSIPHSVNPIVSTIVAYGVALVASIVLYPFFADGQSIANQVKEINWSTYTVGIAIVGIEVGFLLAYRIGWNVSFGAIFSNATATLLLIPLGLLFFKEKISWINITGILLCIAGLWMIIKK